MCPVWRWVYWCCYWQQGRTRKALQPRTLSKRTPPRSHYKLSDLNDVMALLRQQQQELAEQRRLLEAQSQKIATLTRELDTLRKPPVTPAVEQVVDSDAPVPPPTATPAAAPAVAANDGAPAVANASDH